MNGTTLKFGQNFSCPLRRWAALHGSWVVAVGVVFWMLPNVLIAPVEAFTVNELLPVIENPINPPDEARKVATKLIEELAPLIQEEDELAKDLGFIDPSKLPSEPDQLMVGAQPPNPIPVFYITLKSLQDFQTSSSSPTELSVKDYAIALLTEEPNWSKLIESLSPRRFLFPLVNANGQVASSVLVGLGLHSAEWNVIKVGLPSLTQALTDPKLRTPGINYFAINIRSLNRWYLGWISGGEFWLKVVGDDAGINFSKGELRRASEVFFTLKKEAMTIDRSNPAPR